MWSSVRCKPIGRTRSLRSNNACTHAKVSPTNSLDVFRSSSPKLHFTGNHIRFIRDPIMSNSTPENSPVNKRRGSKSSSMSVDDVFLYQSRNHSTCNSPYPRKESSLKNYHMDSSSSRDGSISAEDDDLRCSETIPLRSLRNGNQPMSSTSSSSINSAKKIDAAMCTIPSKPETFIITDMSVDSEPTSEVRPPTPPPRKFGAKNTLAPFRLPCLGKHDGHERPILMHHSSGALSDNPASTSAMSHIAASLQLAHLPAMAVVGVSQDQMRRRVKRLGDGTTYFIPAHRASYHGSRDTSLSKSTDSPIKSKSGDLPNVDILGSAESLVGRVLFEQGLGKYLDRDFVRATQRELAEAINLTQEEMDRAAHQILQLERRRSMPHVHLSLSSEPDSPEKDNAAQSDVAADDTAETMTTISAVPSEPETSVIAHDNNNEMVASTVPTRDDQVTTEDTKL